MAAREHPGTSLAIPLPASMTTRSGREVDGRTSRQVGRVVGEHVALDGPARRPEPAPRRLWRPRSRQTGVRAEAAPARHSFLTPLYLAGLWLAVNIAPKVEAPEAK